MKDTHKQTIVEWKKTNSKTQQSEIKNKKNKARQEIKQTKKQS